MEQRDGTEGRPSGRGLEAQAGAGREVLVYASYQLVRTLLENDLVDELRPVVFPVVLGAGERLFGQASDKKPMRLVDTQTIERDVVFLTYERVRDA